MRIKLTVVALFTTVAVAPLWGHHAFAAEFDAGKPVKLRGTVTKMEWINPHAWIHVDVKDADGKVANWMIECGTPNTLLRRGMTKTSITAGHENGVGRDPSKAGTNKAHAPERTFPPRPNAVPSRTRNRPTA